MTTRPGSLRAEGGLVGPKGVQLLSGSAGLNTVQLIKAILALIGAALAMLMGLVTVAAIAVAAAVYFVVQRLLGRGRPGNPPVRPSRTRPAASGDVIDVTATEVRNDPPAR